ncbi:MAG TPA: site-2 protease family protein [Actinomycetota bacterium]|nr:site-2 protease family protein [Actinomycetota bacterium]
MNIDVLVVIYFVASLLPAIVLHELSHGMVTDRLGDPTPRMMGRLTINPVKHIDPIGTVFLPGILLLPWLFGRPGPVFGYAKPMPVNPANLKDADRQMAVIAVAGPVTNLLLAVVGSLGYRLSGGFGFAASFFEIFVLVNVLLAVFNLLPIPPLDGSKVLARFLPPRAREVFNSLEAYGALFMLLVFFLFPGPVFAIIGPVVSGLNTLFLG